MRKKLKSTLALLLSLVMIVSFVPALGFSFAADADGIVSFSVAAKGSGESADSLGAVNWWRSDVDGKYYLFMPSGSDLSQLKVWVSSSSPVTCGETEIKNGETTDAFSAGGEFTLSCGEKNYSVVFLNSSKLPSVFINVPSGGLDRIHADKEHKEKDCSMLAVNEKGKTDYDGKLDSMKGRGNSTWGRRKSRTTSSFLQNQSFLEWKKQKCGVLLQTMNTSLSFAIRLHTDLAAR